MAVDTIAKWNSYVARLSIRCRIVALLTADLNVQSSERISAERMIKAENIDCFPVNKIVTLETILFQSSLVLVLMTINAGRRNSQKRPGEICDSNRCQLTPVDVVRRMTTAANQTDMLSL